MPELEGVQPGESPRLRVTRLPNSARAGLPQAGRWETPSTPPRSATLTWRPAPWPPPSVPEGRQAPQALALRWQEEACAGAGEGDAEPTAREARPAAAWGTEHRAASEYRPLLPQRERALSAGYWPGQTTPPVRTGPARACRSATPSPATALPSPTASRKERKDHTKLPQPECRALPACACACAWRCPQARGPLQSGGLAASANLPNRVTGGHHRGLSLGLAVPVLTVQGPLGCSRHRAAVLRAESLTPQTQGRCGRGAAHGGDRTPGAP